MATVQAYTKSGVDAKFNSRSNMTMVHNGGGSPDLSAYPDSKTGDVIERSSDGARWGVVASSINPIAGRVVSVAGKTGVVTLGPGDVGAAPSSHTHTKAQISNLNASTTATANSMAQRDAGGRLVVATPTSNTHATTKAYVDSQVTGGITWSNLSGKPSTFAPSSHTHTASQITDLTWGNLSDKPSTFTPSTHSHTISQITDLTVGASNVANTVPKRDANGRFSVANPSAASEVANKAYVDSRITGGVTWDNLSGRPATFSPSAHTHTMANITNLPSVTNAVTNNAIVQRTSSGQVQVPSTPAGAGDAASKSYVDSTVTAGATWSSLAGKPSNFPPSTHTHTVAQISDLTVATAATANTVVKRDSNGRITVANPTTESHAATKSYVDGKVSGSGLATILTTEDLNDVDEPGDYLQNADANATTARNYPAWGRSGHLTVSRRSMFVSQVYTDYLSRARFFRTKHGDNWYPWKTLADQTYVDEAVTDSKAWANLTGKPSTFTPSTHSHTQAQVTGLPAKITAYDAATAKVNSSISTVSGSTSDSGKLLALASTGRFTAVDPSSATDVANKRYVDSAVSSGTTWANTSGKPSTFPPSSHTHTVAQISNLTLSTTATGSSVVQRDSSGRATVATPSSTGHATTKAYVDNAVTDSKKWANLTGKPTSFTPSTHYHTISQITDLPNVVVADTANTVVRRTTTGHINAKLPTAAGHAANKQYVDNLEPWVGTQTQYDAITTKSSTRLYIIT